MSDVPVGYKQTEVSVIPQGGRWKLERNFMLERYIRFFAQECPYIKIGQQPADQLPWLGVAEYQLVRALPEPLDTSLPSVEEIEAELSGGGDG